MISFAVTTRVADMDDALYQVRDRTGTQNANWFRCFPPGFLLCRGAEGVFRFGHVSLEWRYQLFPVWYWWSILRGPWLQLYEKKVFRS